MFEFKQNLPGQLNALLIHVFNGNDISLRWGGNRKETEPREYPRNAGELRTPRNLAGNRAGTMRVRGSGAEVADGDETQ